MTVNNNELLLCPFCGGPAKMKRVNHCYLWNGVSGAEGWAVSCSEPWCPGHNTQVYHVTEGDAVKVWNTRTACDDCQMGGVPATEENMAKYGWVKERTCHWIGIEEWKNPVECSECGVLVVAHVALDSNYCCNCGARVVEE